MMKKKENYAFILAALLSMQTENVSAMRRVHTMEDFEQENNVRAPKPRIVYEETETSKKEGSKIGATLSYFPGLFAVGGFSFQGGDEETKTTKTMYTSSSEYRDDHPHPPFSPSHPHKPSSYEPFQGEGHKLGGKFGESRLAKEDKQNTNKKEASYSKKPFLFDYSLTGNYEKDLEQALRASIQD